MTAQQMEFGSTTEADAYQHGLLDAIHREFKNAEHVAAVIDAIRENVAAGDVFSANDIRAYLPRWIRPNVVGPVFRMLAARKIIRFVGYETSTKRNTHGAKLASWQLRSAP